MKMKTTETDNENISLTRMDIYRFLSDMFVFPDEKNYSMLLEEEFISELSNCFNMFPDADKRDVNRVICSFSASLGGLTLDYMQSEYSRIFGHSISTECPYYETEYGKAHIFQQSQSLADVAGFYRAFGLERSETSKERIDHISTELEFMYFLIFKENYAAHHNKKEESAICIDAQKKFIKDHLGAWVPLFVKLMGDKAGEGFYSGIAELTGLFLRSEVNYLQVKPEEIKELGTLADFEGKNICSSICDN